MTWASMLLGGFVCGVVSTLGLLMLAGARAVRGMPPRSGCGAVDSNDSSNRKT